MADTQDQLLADAKCFCRLSHRQLLEVQTYLLAVIAGGSTDPATLEAASTGFKGLSQSALEEIILYLLCTEAEEVSCDPADLSELATCYDCFPWGKHIEVDTYLLAVKAGGSTDPATLAALARCFCFPCETLLRIQAYLLNVLAAIDC